MCGIVGRFGIKKPSTIVETCKNAWEKMKHRGTDSYGVIVGLADGKIWYAKSLNKDALLNKIKEELDGKEISWFIGHNRKASVGGIKVELAHPIICDDTGFAVIHNGTKRELADVFNTDSDTQALPKVFRYVSEEIRHTVLNGVGVVFAVHRDGYIWFHKDDARPLHIKKMKNGYLFSSEPISEGKWAPIKEVTVKLADISEIVKYAGKFKEIKRKWCSTCQAWYYGDKCPRRHYTYTGYSSKYYTYSYK